MKARYFDEKKQINLKDIELIAREIANGKSVVFPTETVYGIGTNAFNQKACEKIFEIKGRPQNKPLIVLVSNKNMLDIMVNNINQIEQKLIETFWPGPLTIIFEKKGECEISDIVTGGKNSLGIRMTSGKIARMLIEEAGVPIVAPSANLSGKPTGVKIENIVEELGDKVDYILDCGDVCDSTTSTVIQVKENIIYILREGKITKEELSKISEVKIK